ncbi:hypothetical protein O6H91_07G077300 [Diphasiastrum complanatum]|uniref:Uncharacterized protein n=1 Tax=Diphasiastrum complanatum TaxID=34168 RepID=A0ACC2D704_DIPCM|nr:hypothetical protein O6H91_07G077300 [Diphasiastrum complanatum]
MGTMEERHGAGSEESRVLPATRRPDGTLRKPVRIRAGYTPQEEVAIYQSKGSQFRKGALEVPPGYDPVEDAPPKLKTKAAKKNEKRKEKKHQIGTGTSDITSTQRASGNGESCQEQVLQGGLTGRARQAEHVAQLMGSLTMAESCAQNGDNVTAEKTDLEKRIRALRKKIRTAEALQVSLATKEILSLEESEKILKLLTWQQELKELVAAAE